MTSPQKRKFKVKTLSDNIYDFEVDENMKVSDVKALIAEKTNVPVERQRLVFMAKLLENDKTIGSYVTEDDKTVHLMAKIVENDQNSQQQQPGNQQQQPQQQSQQQQQQQSNPFADLLGNFSGMLGFNPMQVIQQIGGPQGQMFNVRPMQPGQNGSGNGNGQQQVGGPFFGGFVVPGSPINVGTSGQNQNQGQNPTTANQPAQQQQAQSQPQQNQHQHTHNHPHHNHNHNHNHQHQQHTNLSALPFNSLQSLGQSITQTMGHGATFPGPPLPPIPNRNSVQILGAYLSQWHFQMSRLLPYVSRLSQLLQRQPIMNNQNDRALTQQMVNRIPAIFENVSHSTRSVIPSYAALRLGNSPGQFTLENNNNQAQNQNNQPQQSNQQNLQIPNMVGQPFVSVQVLSNENLQNLPGLLSGLNRSAPINTNLNSNNVNNGQANQGQEQNQNAFNAFSSSLNDILPNLQGLISGFMPGFAPPMPQQQQPQQQPVPQPVPQQAQQPQQPQQAPTSSIPTQPQSQSQPSPQIPSPPASNPMAALSSFMSNSNLSSMLTPQNINMATTANLRYMISQGQQLSPQNQSVYSLIFGDITGGQLIQLFTSNNYSFFDTRRQDFRRGLETALIRYEGSRERLVEKITGDILPLLVSEQLLAAAIEGFDAELVARQIITAHTLKLINLILDNEPQFSTRLIKQIKLMIGQLIYQLQQGSTKDVPFIVGCIKTSGARVMDPYLMGMSGLVFMLFDKGMYGAYQEWRQGKEKSMKMTQEDYDREKSLMERIVRYGKEDEEVLGRFVMGEKSQYFK